MKNILKSFLKRFIDQAQAFRLSEMAGWARDFAIFKSRRQPKKTKRDGKKPYVPGTLGVSKVSKAIMTQHDGVLLSRRGRRELAKLRGEAFKPVYNR